MIVRPFSVALLLCLGGCADLPPWLALPGQPQGAVSYSDPGSYSFDWQLSGDKLVAPLQLFDNGNDTWLQFPVEQAVPAIFENGAQGQRPLLHERQGPYVVIRGVYPELVFRGGHLQATAHRFDAALSESMPVTSTVPPAGPGARAVNSIPVVDSKPAKALAVDVANARPVDLATPDADTLPESVSDLSKTIAPGSDQPENPGAASALQEAPSLPEASGTQQTTPFSVSAADRNLRQALSRWAGLSGWTFSAEHWVVDVDIPIAASASFESEFIPSVQALVAATELSDRPLQPCFYANRVLRVVAYTQPCDRTAGPDAGVSS
jgi:hypothetical protein